MIELCQCRPAQWHWANIGTMLAALAESESDIEASNAVTVWLLQCQCQSSDNSAEPALAQRWS